MSRRSFIALVPLLFVAGCAKSLGPASPPFGSGALGYSDRALDGGLFEVQAVAPTQASAEKTFEMRAKQLCRGSYRLKDDEDIREPRGHGALRIDAGGLFSVSGCPGSTAVWNALQPPTRG